jgi:hypothetical protein
MSPSERLEGGVRASSWFAMRGLVASDAASAGRSRGTMEGVPVDDSRVCTEDGLRCSVASTGSTGILVMGMGE